MCIGIGSGIERHYYLSLQQGSVKMMAVKEVRHTK